MGSGCVGGGVGCIMGRVRVVWIGSTQKSFLSAVMKYKRCYAELFGISPRTGTKSRTVPLIHS